MSPVHLLKGMEGNKEANRDFCQSSFFPVLRFKFILHLERIAIKKFIIKKTVSHFFPATILVLVKHF